MFVTTMIHEGLFQFRVKALLFFAATLLITKPSSAALVYSSTLSFKLTSKRVEAKDLESITPYRSISPVTEPLSRQNPSQETPLSSWTSVPRTAALDLSRFRGKIPPRHNRQARIYVVDEEALLNGQLKAIPNAQVTLIHPAMKSGPILRTSSEGLATIPYPFTESVRFFVQVPDFALGMGYATFGNVSIVPLLSNRRLSALLQSLNLQIPSGEIAVFGKLSNEELRGIPGSQIKFKSGNPQMFYSGSLFGGLHGYFTESFNKTDAQGLFIASGLGRKLHDLEILNRERQFPTFQIDLSGIPENIRFVSISLQVGPAVNLASSVLDGDTFERPNCGLTTRLPSPEKIAVPDDEGNVWLDLTRSSFVHDFKVDTSACKGYLPTFLTQIAHNHIFPPNIGLFSKAELQESISSLNRSWDPSETLVLGHVYPQKEFKHAPIGEVSLNIIDSKGERAAAEILYFDHNNELDPRKTTTDAHFQNFMVLGLEEGEYHFIYRNALRGSGLGMQVVRVKRGGVTQVDF